MDDGFSFILGLLAIATFVLGPTSFVLILLQRGRLNGAEQHIIRLQDRVRLLEAGKTSQQPPVPSPEPIQEPVPDETPLAMPEPIASTTPKPEPQPGTPPTPPPNAVPTAAPRPPRRSLEEALGTRWSVWVGGLALGLGALMLVRYSIEQGFFGPGARILMGLMLAAALVVGGEVLRRRQRGNVPASVDIPAMLTACGAVAAFGAIYAAYGVYEFIDGTLAFLILAIVALACMIASALHGPRLAGLGLLGSLVTPLLVSTQNPNPWTLTIYLAVVCAAAHGLARLRGWTWLSMASAAGGLAWMAFFWLSLEIGSDTIQAFQSGSVHLVLQALMASYMLAYARFRTPERNIPVIDTMGCFVPILFSVIAEAWITIAGTHDQFGALWILVGVTVTGLLAGLAVTTRPVMPLFAASGLFVLALVDGWPGVTGGIVHPIYWMPPGIVVGVTPVSAGLFGAVAIALSLGLATLGARRLQCDTAMSLREGAVISGSAALTPLGVLVIAWLRMGVMANDFLFAALAASLAAVFVCSATLFRQMLPDAGPGDRDRLTFSLGVSACAAFGALALALVFALQGGTLTVALALAALGCAYVSMRLDIAELRWCVTGFAVAIAARLAWDPRIVGDDLGKTLIFNWLLFGYGLPALAMGIAARIMRRAGSQDRPVQIAQAACILLSGFLVLFEIRHALYDGNIYADRSSIVEQGLNTFAAFGFAGVLTRLDSARKSIVFRIASYGFGILSLAGAIFGLGIRQNPYLFGDRVMGGAFLNTLLIGYAMPALAAYAVARLSDGRRHPAYVMAMRLAAILLTFAYLTLETRQWFHPNGDLSFWRSTPNAEFYAYSAVWLVFALVLLAYGVWRGSREARLGSAVFLVLTVLKVFLLDLEGLEGLLRALSFIGLGLVLIGVGLVYQKLIFHKPPEDVV